jgi:hypothetical protein
LLGERGRERLGVFSLEGGVVDYCNSGFFLVLGIPFVRCEGRAETRIVKALHHMMVAVYSATLEGRWIETRVIKDMLCLMSSTSKKPRLIA